MGDNELLQAISDMLDKKLERILDEKLDKMLDEKLAPIYARLDKIEARLDKIEARLDKIEARLDKVEARLDKVEADVASLKAGQLRMSKKLDVLEQKITETYELALDAWGKSVENKHWLEHGKSLLNKG